MFDRLLSCWLWTYFKSCSSVSIVNFEQVYVGWHISLITPLPRTIDKLKEYFVTWAALTQVIFQGGPLTLSWRRPLSYRNQFLYDNGPRHERVSECTWRLNKRQCLRQNIRTFSWSNLGHTNIVSFGLNIFVENKYLT